MHTDRLMPQPQLTKVGTLVRIRAATVSTASRSNQGGLPPPSVREATPNQLARNKANASLSANSITAAMPAFNNEAVAVCRQCGLPTAYDLGPGAWLTLMGSMGELAIGILTPGPSNYYCVCARKQCNESRLFL